VKRFQSNNFKFFCVLMLDHKNSRTILNVTTLCTIPKPYLRLGKRCKTLSLESLALGRLDWKDLSIFLINYTYKGSIVKVLYYVVLAFSYEPNNQP